MTDTPAERRDALDERRNRHARRSVLRVGAATAGLAVGLPSPTSPGGFGGIATGQETGTPESAITTIGAIRDQEEFDQDLTGFWVHLAGRLDPYEASVADQCAEIPWTDQEAMAFDAQLIDRTADPEQSRVTVYLHDAIDVNSGDLFIVNEVTTCEGPYTVLRLEQIGADAIGVGPENVASPTGTTDADGAGVGIPAAVAALLGGGWLAHLLRGGEEQKEETRDEG